MELNPVFGKIYDLVTVGVSEYYIVCELLVTEAFNYHLHAFEVSIPSSPNFLISKTSDLIDHNVLGIYTISGIMYISLKYKIFENL